VKNTKPKVRLWSVLTGLTAILTVAAIVGNIIANQYATTINVALNASTYKIIHGENTGDTEYFKKGFASDEEREAYEAELCATVEAEGAALLKNENNALPLASGAKVSLFGHGSVEGIAAAESANNAVTGGALIPLLTLGVPGDVVTAIMLGALMIQGMTPGPLLFQEQGTLVYSIFIALFVSNVFMLLLGYYAVRLAALNNSNFDLAVMAGFGLLGYIMTKARFPLAPLLLAMILSGIIETNFRRALSISNQDFSVFFTRPVCAAFLAISLFILFNLLWKEWKKYRAASAA